MPISAKPPGKSDGLLFTFNLLLQKGFSTLTYFIECPTVGLSFLSILILYSLELLWLSCLASISTSNFRKCFKAESKHVFEIPQTFKFITELHINMTAKCCSALSDPTASATGLHPEPAHTHRDKCRSSATSKSFSHLGIFLLVLIIFCSLQV